MRVVNWLLHTRTGGVIAGLALIFGLAARTCMMNSPNGPWSGVKEQVDGAVRDLQRATLLAKQPIDPYKQSLSDLLIHYKLSGRMTSVVAPGIDQPLRDIDQIAAVLSPCSFPKDIASISTQKAFREGVGTGRQEVALVMRIPLIGTSWIRSNFFYSQLSALALCLYFGACALYHTVRWIKKGVKKLQCAITSASSPASSSPGS